MPNPSNSPEAAAIEAAYQAHVELLFKSLVTNLGDQVVSHQSDQQSLDKFKAGLNIAKRAKRLALPAVSPDGEGEAAEQARSISSINWENSPVASTSLQRARMRSAVSTPSIGCVKRRNFSRTRVRSKGRAGSPGTWVTSRAWRVEPAATRTRAGQLAG